MIGVFDSGHGGLTVLDALRRSLPRETFLYLGDHARAPYGVRSGPEILALTRSGVRTLFDEGCGLVILACNTASAVALRRLQQDWLPQAFPERRVLGVVVPTIEVVAGAGFNGWATAQPSARRGRVALFATQATVESRVFEIEMHKRAPGIEIWAEACLDLARLIEDGAPADVLRACVDGHVRALLARAGAGGAGARPFDAALLGCTHFPLVRDAFEAALPPETEIVCQPSQVAAATRDYLARHPRFASPGTGGVRLLTTGDPGQVERVAAAFASALSGLAGARFEPAPTRGRGRPVRS